MSEMDLPRILDLQIPITLNDILKKWSHQAGCFEKSVTIEVREKKYMEALLALFSLFAKHHEEMSDGDFVRAFRFFKDSGIAKRLSSEAPIAGRYAKLELIEPGMEEPKPVEPHKESTEYSPTIMTKEEATEIGKQAAHDLYKMIKKEENESEKN